MESAVKSDRIGIEMTRKVKRVLFCNQGYTRTQETPDI